MLRLHPGSEREIEVVDYLLLLSSKGGASTWRFDYRKAHGSPPPYPQPDFPTSTQAFRLPLSGPRVKVYTSKYILYISSKRENEGKPLVDTT